VTVLKTDEVTPIKKLEPVKNSLTKQFLKLYFNGKNSFKYGE